MLVRIIKNWKSPELMRQTPYSSGVWEDVQFTCESVYECDAVIVLNRVPESTLVRCAPENIWVLMQEPYIKNVFEWMVKGHDQYEHVFTHHPVSRGVAGKYIPCHPAVPWHINKTYDELSHLKVPVKTKSVSWITSNLTSFPGHKRRMEFLAYLRSMAVPVDLYGKGIHYIEDKWEGLAPYQYSLAIENNSGPDYWTEKVADCFLSWTVPIYYGCTNLEDYFPKESFIRIDIKKPALAVETILKALDSDSWESRLPALEKARHLVLERYQFFPEVKKKIDQYYSDTPKREILMKPFTSRKSVFQNIVRRISGMA